VGCDLFGPLLLKGDVVRQPVRFATGQPRSLTAQGLGQVDEDALEMDTEAVTA